MPGTMLYGPISWESAIRKNIIEYIADRLGMSFLDREAKSALSAALTSFERVVPRNPETRENGYVGLAKGRACL